MNIPGSTNARPLRLWPGVLAAVLLCLTRFVIPIVEPDAIFFAGIGGMVCALAIVAWWLFFSRAPWSERVGAIVCALSRRDARQAAGGSGQQ